VSRRKPEADPRLAVAYVRVSTEDQRLGPEAQREQIEAWATREGVVVASWHHDQGVSGGAALDRRPGLAAALADVRDRRAGALVVAKRDRLARDVAIAASVERELARTGARVISADGTGNGEGAADQFMRTMLDGVAQYERALIRGRVRAALGVKQARGEMTGKPRWGYRLDADGVHVVEDPAEQAVVARARSLRAEGASLKGVVEALRAEGVVGRSGRPLAVTQIARMLGGRR
jgi:DNA invertase Pin-like site-specific DNA recombinase